jgi:cysteine synthase A
MLSMIQKIEFPWRQTVDAIEEVGTQESYATSIELSRAGIVGGPSSGLGYKGTCTTPDTFVEAI